VASIEHTKARSVSASGRFCPPRPPDQGFCNLYIVSLVRDVGYMRICDRICDRIFWQKVQITYFSAYDGIFEIAYAENTPHMLKFAYIAQISAYAIAFFSIIPTDVNA